MASVLVFASVLAGALMTVATQIMARRNWARCTAIVLSLASVLALLLELLDGVLSWTLLLPAASLVVLTLLSRTAVQEWFSDPIGPAPGAAGEGRAQVPTSVGIALAVCWIGIGATAWSAPALFMSADVLAVLAVPAEAVAWWRWTAIGAVCWAAVKGVVCIRLARHSNVARRLLVAMAVTEVVAGFAFDFAVTARWGLMFSGSYLAVACFWAGLTVMLLLGSTARRWCLPGLRSDRA